VFLNDPNGTAVAPNSEMKVRLTKKLAEMLDGVDLSRRRVGDVMDLPDSEARLIVAEQWAELVDDGTPCSPCEEHSASDHLPRAS
jgi:hypothetical protein